MKTKDLAPNAENPRFCSKAKRAQLKKSLAAFGDLSGIVYNRRTKTLVGGHQRKALFDGDTPITITRKFSKPSKTGTVAEGYIEIGTDRFGYREVYWDEIKEKAANIAANKGAGVWDHSALHKWLKEIDAAATFDIDLTMFDVKEMAELPVPIEVSAHTRNPNKEDDQKPKGPAKCKAGEVYILGESRLLCGGDSLHFCDSVISKWNKYSGEEATLQTPTKKKAAQQPVSSRAKDH